MTSAENTTSDNLQLSGGPFGRVISRVSAGLRGPPVISEIRCPPPSSAPARPRERCAVGALAAFSRAYLGKKRYQIALLLSGISYRSRLILSTKFRPFFL